MKAGTCGFNPCLFNEHVYICSSFPSRIDTFSPQTDRFLQLPPLALPVDSGFCLYVRDHCLVIHSNNSITKFSEGRSGQLLRSSQVCCRSYLRSGFNFQPVLDPARSLFFIVYRDMCFGFHMETGVRVDFSRFS